MINMSRSLFFAFFAVLLAGYTAVPAQKQSAVPTVKKNLVASLPASDAVALLDTQKLLKVALPQILGADSPKLAEVNNHIAAIKDKAGIDLRQFENVAVGIKYKQVSATETDFEPVVLVDGSFNAGAMLALAKLAANGKYREEKIGERIIYIMQMPSLGGNGPGNAKPSLADQAINGMLRAFSGEIAIGAFDGSTLVAGPPARVRETLDGGSPLSLELRNALAPSAGTIVSFYGNTPAGFGSMIGLDVLGNDEIGKIIGSIKAVSGNLQMNGTDALLTLAGKTGTTLQATDLEDTARGLQSLGKALIGSLKGSEQDKEMYARLIEGTKITRVGMQVKVVISIPKADLNILGKKL